MKVYLVIRRWFFEENGTDYAMPLETSDFEIFKRKKDAVERFEQIRNWANDEIELTLCINTIQYNNCLFGFEQKYKTANTRRIVTVETKEII